MNYNIQGMVKTLADLFTMLKYVEVEIKKEHMVLMVNKTTKFKKSVHKNGKKPKKDGKPIADTYKATRLGPKPTSRASTSKGTGTQSATSPSTSRTRKPQVCHKRQRYI